MYGCSCNKGLALCEWCKDYVVVSQHVRGRSSQIQQLPAVAPQLSSPLRFILTTPTMTPMREVSSFLRDARWHVCFFTTNQHANAEKCSFALHAALILHLYLFHNTCSETDVPRAKCFTVLLYTKFGWPSLQDVVTSQAH